MMSYGVCSHHFTHSDTSNSFHPLRGSTTWADSEFPITTSLPPSLQMPSCSSDPHLAVQTRGGPWGPPGPRPPGRRPPATMPVGGAGGKGGELSRDDLLFLLSILEGELQVRWSNHTHTHTHLTLMFSGQNVAWRSLPAWLGGHFLCGSPAHGKANGFSEGLQGEPTANQDQPRSRVR